MRIHLFILLSLLVCGLAIQAETEDNEFAEFEEEEVEVTPQPAAKPEPAATRTVKDNTDQVELDDDDDFGLVEEDGEEIDEQKDAEQPSAGPQPLKFADVPAHFRSNWASYQVEALVLALLAAYLLNYVIGRSTNFAIASDWFSTHKSFLQQQFAVVGDDGLSENASDGTILRDTDYSFSIWCSGRIGVSGLTIQMKTMKRQDLVSRVMHMLSPQNDTITFKFDFDANEMDSWVFAIGNKKAASKQFRDMADLTQYTVEKKNTAVNGIPSSFTLYSEISEASAALLDPWVLSQMRKYEHLINFVHISDQFCGQKLAEGETYTKLPEVSKVAIFSFVLGQGDTEAEGELLALMMHMLDKSRRLKLSREGKIKGDKKRQAVEEAFLKTTHVQRQEAAQARREERTRERKQRLLEEEDPDKQRKLEKLEAKHERKMKQPKMKQLKVR